MKAQKIALEQHFSLHQKFMLFGFTLITFLLFTRLILSNLKPVGYAVAGVFLLLSLYLLALTFAQKGVMKRKENLYTILFLFGLIIHRKRVSLVDRPVVSILMFRKKQKFAFVPSANPDQSESFNTFEIFVLNKQHTKREALVYFKSESNAKKVVEFLTQHFPLRFEVFNPDFG